MDQIQVFIPTILKRVDKLLWTLRGRGSIRDRKHHGSVFLITGFPEMTEEEKGQDGVSVSRCPGSVKSLVTAGLVCISGREAGNCYRLHAGKIFIGRSQTMDVPIKGRQIQLPEINIVQLCMNRKIIPFIAGESGNMFI